MTRRHNIVDSVDTYVCKAKGYAKLKDCNCDGCKMDTKRKTLKKGQHYFVLCENVVAANLNSSSVPLKQTLQLGTIVIATKKVDNNKVGVSISEYEKSYSKLAGKIWVCPLISLHFAPAEMIPYILPIPSQCRVNILKDDVLCMNLQSLAEGDEIYVVESHEDSPSRAVIKERGVFEKGGGIFFNVALLDTNEDVTSNSSTLRRGRKTSLSSKDFIIASDRIRLTPNGGTSLPMPVNSRQSVNQLRKKFETLSTTSQPRCVDRLPPSSPPVYARVGQLIDLSDHSADGLVLKQGERVIWLGEDGPLPGFIAEFRNPDKVILRLDVPIRTRDETYSTDKLLVPKLELIKVDDYYDKHGSGRGYSDYSCEKSCQASNVENLINSTRDRTILPSSAPQHIPSRSCYNGASAPPRELCLTPTNNRDSQDYCDYNNHLNHQMIDSMALSPSKISPNLSSSSSNLEDYDESHSPVGVGNNLDNHLDLGVGSMVEVLVDDVPYYGVIRWTGHIYSRGPTVAGIEMEEEHEKFCEGDMHGKRYFNCNPRRGHFVPLFQCLRDPRFIESHCPSTSSHLSPSSPDKEFGGLECPIIPGRVEPISQEKNIDSICGKFRGIQGHHNSCYLDATLFAMFTFTGIFDSLLFRPPPDSARDQYNEVQQVLREEIVNPLRTNLFVRADRVMHLRTLLNELSSVSGLTTEEKDPEEFLTSLVAQILRAEPFLKLSSGQEAFHYQLFVEKDEKLTFPSVQQLFEQSFFASDIKLKEVPPSLIIQMPRFGKSYKMYPRILPTQYLDITDVLEDSPRQCTICGNLAQFECRKCFDQCDTGLQSIWYCRPCLEKTHSQKRTDHESCWRTLKVSDYFQYTSGGTECNVPRIFMELFAVVCIETSHYVAFVKGGSGCDAPWCFFDSMADRKGERNGYNIPEMVSCPELPYWLSDKGSHYLNSITDDRQLPEHAKRLMCDAYMVMYQSTDVMMYR